MGRDGRPTGFLRGERGAITPLMLVLFIGLTLVIGAAIDMARHEGERADLQDALDRGVLAAASLRMATTVDSPEAVAVLVDEFVSNRNISARDASVTLDPATALVYDADTGAASRTIVAEARFELPTTIFNMAGLSKFDVVTDAAAVQSNRTEISFVIDISGSMGRSADGGNVLTGLSRIERLRPAAKAFVENVIGDTIDQVSINLVPYAGQTNPGRAIFDYVGGIQRWRLADDGTVDRDWLAENAGTAKTRFTPTGPGDDTDPCLDQDGDGIADEPGAFVCVPTTCPELDILDFDALSGAYVQVPANGPYLATHRFHNWAIDAETMDWGWCPGEAGAIHVHEGDKRTLGAAIDGLRLHDGTGTYNGLKWGIALLNPLSNPLVRHLAGEGEVAAAFADRPLPISDPTVVKAVVLMTDGGITEQVRPRAPSRAAGASDAEYQDEIDTWLGELATVEIEGSDNTAPVRPGFAAWEGRDRFLDLCAAAEAARIEIYAIAFEAPLEAAQQMKDCVGGPETGRYYEADRVNLDRVFEAIASEINNLRLFN
ncbi:MAG: pilus assembly protein [Paracoccaceae bacterium]